MYAWVGVGLRTVAGAGKCEAGGDVKAVGCGCGGWSVVEHVVGSSVRGVRPVLCVPIAWELEQRSVPAGAVDASCVPEVQTLLQPACWRGLSSTGCSECVTVGRAP